MNPGLAEAASGEFPGETENGNGRTPRWRKFLRSLKVPALAIFSALFLGGILIILTDTDVLWAWARFFNDPMRALTRSWEAVWDAYSALFAGAFGSLSAWSETLLRATPLILAGLAVAFAFKASLFNIGANGQMILGAIFSAYVGFTFDVTGWILVPLALAGGVLGGFLWGGIAGVLKATTGAHEVITTIMLNFIAAFLLAYFLTTDTFLPSGSANPISKNMLEQARLHRFIGGERVDIGIFVAIAAVVLVWWVLEKSTLGFQVKAVGLSPDAAKYSGMKVALIIALTLAAAGGLAGLAGATVVLGATGVLTGGVIGNLGFDAIAVALLGRSNPWGVLAAAILFGGLNAGAVNMQAETQIPVDIVIVIQALIILFVAAPGLVRAIYRIKKVDTEEAQSFTSSWGSS